MMRMALDANDIKPTTSYPSTRASFWGKLSLGAPSMSKSRHRDSAADSSGLQQPLASERSTLLFKSPAALKLVLWRC
jgi:hypothetical protein